MFYYEKSNPKSLILLFYIMIFVLHQKSGLMSSLRNYVTQSVISLLIFYDVFPNFSTKMQKLRQC